MDRYAKMSDEEIYTAHGYNITDDPHFLDKELGITPQLHQRIERLYFESQEGARGAINELQQLIRVYPDVPQLKNLLMGAYMVNGNARKSYEINQQLLIRHPDYLFGKINEAFRRIQHGEIDTVHEVVGDHWNLQQLYPERDVFQVAEVLGFHKLATFYFVQREDLERAEHHLSILKDIAIDHPDTGQAETFLFPLRMKMARDRWQRQKEKAIAVEIVNWPSDPPLASPPVFQHPEIDDLYRYGMDFPPEKLDALLRLPRETLIVDLLAVLRDGVDRYYTFADNGWDDTTCHFPVHALWLLSELKAEEALDRVLAFFEYDDEFLDFWFGDAITSTVWQSFFALGQKQPEVLGSFLRREGISANAKCAVSEALAQIGLHFPKRREEIIGIYQQVLTSFRDAQPLDNLVDTQAITYLVGDAVDAGFAELLPIIEDLHKLEYVDEQMNGTFQDLARYMERYAADPRKRGVESMADHYAGWTEETDTNAGDFAYPATDRYQSPQPVVSQKVGRNDPCPCGSGKKYKKCCGAAG
ncbi:SEC-C metal-binding domain-containing protein [Parapedobacter soli]|uniref:SEC-C metal-binding domain-containing protein n=1 Tax=Parapedobacter soli TaxID=416955 RepID=UPI0021CAB729|nr:SEC-C metal-binding domain-containing protein [Parapedobacter soli]